MLSYLFSLSLACVTHSQAPKCCSFFPPIARAACLCFPLENSGPFRYQDFKSTTDTRRTVEYKMEKLMICDARPNSTWDQTEDVRGRDMCLSLFEPNQPETCSSYPTSRTLILSCLMFSFAFRRLSTAREERPTTASRSTQQRAATTLRVLAASQRPKEAEPL